MPDAKTTLPKELIDPVTNTFVRFLRIEAGGGAVLFLSSILAMYAANSAWAGPVGAFWDLPAGVRIGGFETFRSFRDWVNDAAMTFFFFVVALELKRALTLGELRNVRVAALSLAGALGGMAVPAAFYVALTHSDSAARGWGMVMTTDTAFVLGCLALLGSRVPVSLRLFLLSLAIFDDVGSIIVVALGYGHAIDWWSTALVGGVLSCIALMAYIGIRAVWCYFAVGTILWFAMDASGIHATLTGVILGLMTPSRSWVSDNRLRAILDRVLAQPSGENWSGESSARRDLRRAVVAARETLSPIERLEMMLHPWVAFAILPAFALANAGVTLTDMQLNSTLFTAALVAFVLGKPIGVFVMSALAVYLRIAIRPPTLTWPMLAAGACLTGIGFTMALFIAELAFDPGLLNSAKLAILTSSIAAGAIGMTLLFIVTRRPSADTTQQS